MMKPLVCGKAANSPARNRTGCSMPSTESQQQPETSAMQKMPLLGTNRKAQSPPASSPADL